MAKTGFTVYQWQIMNSLGFSNDEIYEFRNPSKWMEYFPTKAIEDLKLMGVKVSLFLTFIM